MVLDQLILMEKIIELALTHGRVVSAENPALGCPPPPACRSIEALLQDDPDDYPTLPSSGFFVSESSSSDPFSSDLSLQHPQLSSNQMVSDGDPLAAPSWPEHHQYLPSSASSFPCDGKCHCFPTPDAQPSPGGGYLPMLLGPPYLQGILNLSLMMCLLAIVILLTLLFLHPPHPLFLLRMGSA